MALICSGCRSENPTSNRFCGQCGQPLDGAEQVTGRPFVQPGNSQGERKRVTVLFADIIGSTLLIQDLDPESAAERLEPALKVMVDAVHAFDGTVNRVQGDGIMALFGAPFAHEDHAVRACYAALRMQERQREFGDGELALRVGLNSGEVVVRSIGNDLWMDYDAMGLTVHLAARMEQSAAAGSIRVTSHTFRLAEGFIEARPLGPTNIKGLRQPLATYELIGATPARSRWQARASRGLTRLVGRDDDLATLDRALTRARAGQGQVVGLVGEPGIGKSRLLHEFLQSDAVRDATVLSAAAGPYDINTAYHAIGGLLQQWFTIGEHDDRAQIGAKVAAQLAAIDAALTNRLPALSALLGLPVTDPDWLELDPPLRRSRIIEAVVDLVLAAAAGSPLVLVFEDLHWADSESLATLASLADALAAAPVLLLATYRSEHEPHWSDSAEITTLRLEPLGDDAAETLLDQLLGTGSDLAELKQRLLNRAEGTPLFLEETVRSLSESGVLDGDPGAYRLIHDASRLDIPASVQAVLAARIDRLSSEPKWLLQVASVIGPDTPLALLRAVAGMPEDRIRDGLATLTAAEFLYNGQPLQAPQYSFRHVLAQEVAYASLLIGQRRALHVQTLQAIELQHADRLEEYVERLAHHAVLGELWDKGVSYLRRSADKAIERSAYREANTFLGQALEALPQLPEGRESTQQAIDVRLEFRVTLGASGEFQRMYHYLDEAEALAREIEDVPRLAAAGIAKTSVLGFLGRLDAAIAVGQRVHRMADASGNPALLLPASIYLGQALLWRGDVREAAQLLDRDVGFANTELRHRRVGTTATGSVLWAGLLAATRANLGEFDAAVRSGEEACRIAEERQRPFDLGLANWYLGYVHNHRGEIALALQFLERALDICRNRNVPFLIPVVATSLAHAQVLAGRPREALELLDTLAAHTRSGTLPYAAAWLASHQALACLAAGRSEEAAAHAGDAMQLVRRHTFRTIEVATLRLKARLAAQANGATRNRAEDLLHEALDLAQTQAILPDQAHCRLELGELHAANGERAEAAEQGTAALRLYRRMGMAYWPDRAEALLQATGPG